MRDVEQDDRNHGRDDQLRKHVRAVVEQAVKHCAVCGEALPELAEALPDDHAAQEMHHEAECDGDHDTADPAGCLLFAEQAAQSEHCERDDVIEKYTCDQHEGCEPPSEESVTDPLEELDQGKQERYCESGFQAAPDREKYYRKHGKQGDRAAPRQFVNTNVAECCGKGKHHGALYQNSCSFTLHKNALLFSDCFSVADSSPTLDRSSR